MKREIKFRVWDGNKMEYNVMAGFLGAFYVQGMDEKDSASMSPFNTQYPDECVPMQYTGLRDRDGIEIYEGDIIPSANNTGIHEVKFENGAFTWGGDLLGYSYEDGAPVEPYPTEKWAKVIGNKFQHPELLIDK